jgi:hypothetical protein
MYANEKTYGVQYDPQCQASSGGLGTYTLRIRGMTILTFGLDITFKETRTKYVQRTGIKLQRGSMLCLIWRKRTEGGRELSYLQL